MTTLLETLLNVSVSEKLSAKEFDYIFQPMSHEQFVKAQNWILNEDGSYDCEGDVRIDSLGLLVRFRNVKGNFYCSNNNLTSLEGCPESVGGDFYCHDNSVSEDELKKTVERDYL